MNMQDVLNNLINEGFSIDQIESCVDEMSSYYSNSDNDMKVTTINSRINKKYDLE